MVLHWVLTTVVLLESSMAVMLVCWMVLHWVLKTVEKLELYLVVY